MIESLYKCFLFFCFTVPGPRLTVEKAAPSVHPIFVSVTEIEHNAAEKSLEISCKLFTDDFEKALRKNYPVKIDLLDEKMKTSMNPLVNAYIQKHLSIKADGKAVKLEFLGYEQQEEGIVSFFQVMNIASVKKIEVGDNLLYEFYEQQMGIVHVKVNGIRKSYRLNNPDANANFDF